MTPPLVHRVRVILAACFWAVRVESVIRRRPLASLTAMVGIGCDFTPAAEPRDASDRLVTLSRHDMFALRVVSRVYGRWPVPGTCLRECLVAGRLLRYRAPVLRIGVAPATVRVQAHSWLEFDGVAVDPTADSYARLSTR